MLLYHRQPWTGIYLAFHVIALLWIRLPYWTLISLPRSWRPRQSWTLFKSVLVRTVRHFITVTNQTGDLGLPNHLSIKPCKDATGVWIGPANHLVTGNLKKWAEFAGVESICIPGYWIYKPGSEISSGSVPRPDEKVIYYLHGGGYIRMSAHPSDLTAAIPKNLVQLSDSVTRAFSLEYRLATAKPLPDAHPFPTQLLDALVGYNYLVNLAGFEPKNIIVAGDSAGGNLAHALTQYLVDHQDSQDVPIPNPPGALLLICPWVDLSDSCVRDGQNPKNAASDYLKAPGTDGAYEYSRSAFLGPHGLSLAENSHYISPASLSPTVTTNFKNFPRTFINAGGAEVLIETIQIYRDRMVKELGEGDGVREGDGKVRYFEMPDGVHDYIGFNWFEPERTLTFQEIKRWFEAS